VTTKGLGDSSPVSPPIPTSLVNWLRPPPGSGRRCSADHRTPCDFFEEALKTTPLPCYSLKISPLLRRIKKRGPIRPSDTKISKKNVAVAFSLCIRNRGLRSSAAPGGLSPALSLMGCGGASESDIADVLECCPLSLECFAEVVQCRSIWVRSPPLVCRGTAAAGTLGGAFCRLTWPTGPLAKLLGEATCPRRITGRKSREE
jgi:hypothetical protein